ncbi:interactor of constitutive active ROPs 3 isoform X2 [Tripterygium wilfordii]|uniref:Interactor of constitutive active ROPs 3 isoform X2 n=1 Tax=Tripterygium wilfordii TaxID=458696 RepID=A0A7J7DYW5_TRIWF|nr:interactor of constitutive active ROPs 3-like isoform X2 [Tripterygium wilfordii]XP_038710829.1 interactor of constitutive active ROPs 3-like isoform X2 [Tripterygium wilfordii]XP_038710835.1 interactor of constitutive active ROPs 3-like isoform X2 [Tripterygium wilfordii]XP_038710841.1 interactor of constitutive active ROPs 3-like isoform X2 [Tripterygium wilfordii]XP_038710849.1 interactor of constitutive active ROPs 3-like isoform X2 [Tripterygium wilfordii]KAF5751517.1 interactor of con
METPKGRSDSSKVPQKVSPRPVRQLKPTALESDSSSSSNQTRTPKERSPKVVERRSPRSPVSERKRPSRISELESQVSQLQEELKKVKDQLNLSESGKKEAQQEAEDYKKQLSAVSVKLEEPQKQLHELPASEQAHVVELQRISQEQDSTWLSQLDVVQKQQSLDSAALAAATNKIQQLTVQLEMVAESEALQTKHAESRQLELQSLKGNLVETLSIVEDMKNQLSDSKESEAQAKALANETLLQLETAKKTVEALRSDGMRTFEDYNIIISELEKSRTRVNFLEGLVGKLKSDLLNASSTLSQKSTADDSIEYGIEGPGSTDESKQLHSELSSLKSEVGRLRSALQAAEAKCHEVVQVKKSYELAEQAKYELEKQLEKLKADIEELKADLMDKETELQAISEENEGLNMKIKNSLLSKTESEIENELKKLNEHIGDLKASLMDKETELQNISEENASLKKEISRRELERVKVKDEVVVEVEAARAAEREALTKLGVAMEEADKSNRKAARVFEQLEAAQAASSEMEAELRRLKVQSDQWRKAAEAAASMLSAGNNGKFMDRTGSLENNYNPVLGNISSPYDEDMDDDLLKKKNGNMLKKIGVLWKKPQK